MDIERLINFLIKLWDLQARQDHAGTATRRPKVTENHFKIMWSWWLELSLSSPVPECQCQCPNCLQMGILWTVCSLVGPFRVRVHSGPPRTACECNSQGSVLWVNFSLLSSLWVQCSLYSWLYSLFSSLFSLFSSQCSLFSSLCSLFSSVWVQCSLYSVPVSSQCLCAKSWLPSPCSWRHPTTRWRIQHWT